MNRMAECCNRCCESRWVATATRAVNFSTSDVRASARTRVASSTAPFPSRLAVRRTRRLSECWTTKGNGHAGCHIRYIMERLEGFGDPHVLLLAQDHIVLKLESPWSHDVPFPEGCSLGEDGGGTSLITNQKCLVAAQRALRGRTRALKALFAGCAPFHSSDRYARAASELLRDAEEICIVHNRDQVYRLIRMFPSARVLALPHDMCQHVVETYEPRRNRSAPLVEDCQLTQLLGGVESMGHFLMMSNKTLRLLVRSCPKLSRIDTGDVLDTVVRTNSAMATSRPRGERFTYLLLFPAVAPDGRFVKGTESADVVLAARTFPNLEILKVGAYSAIPLRTTSCVNTYINATSMAGEYLKALANVSAFHNVRDFHVSFDTVQSVAEADLQRLLRRWPELEALELCCCEGVRIATVARLCPNVKRLRLTNFVASSQDLPLQAGSFPRLERLELSLRTHDLCFDALLVATRDTLRSVSLHDDANCSAFLHFLVRCARRVRFFPRLEELVLRTQCSVRALGLRPQDLRSALPEALPALRRLQTNSFDLRLLFENYGAPPGRLSLSWIECVYCAVHAVSVPNHATASAIVSHVTTNLQ
ncbi:uncharacterized protein [Dermacentor albipictus]|uniref:uncharacterized protein isoform X2 n=1 Tax=Dermacentor albipictus TaxID=60249 RepID=UPI0038FC8003